jgi:hypothetical protein
MVSGESLARRCADRRRPGSCIRRWQKRPDHASPGYTLDASGKTVHVVVSLLRPAFAEPSTSLGRLTPRQAIAQKAQTRAQISCCLPQILPRPWPIGLTNTLPTSAMLEVSPA